MLDPYGIGTRATHPSSILETAGIASGIASGRLGIHFKHTEDILETMHLWLEAHLRYTCLPSLSWLA